MSTHTLPVYNQYQKDRWVFQTEVKQIILTFLVDTFLANGKDWTAEFAKRDQSHYYEDLVINGTMKLHCDFKDKSLEIKSWFDSYGRNKEATRLMFGKPLSIKKHGAAIMDIINHDIQKGIERDENKIKSATNKELSDKISDALKSLVFPDISSSGWLVKYDETRILFHKGYSGNYSVTIDNDRVIRLHVTSGLRIAERSYTIEQLSAEVEKLIKAKDEIIAEYTQIVNTIKPIL